MTFYGHIRHRSKGKKDRFQEFFGHFHGHIWREEIHVHLNPIRGIWLINDLLIRPIHSMKKTDMMDDSLGRLKPNDTYLM